MLHGEEKHTTTEHRGFKLLNTQPGRATFGADRFHWHDGPLFQSQPFENNELDRTFTVSCRESVPLNAEDQSALVAFLKTLTDEEFMSAIIAANVA